MLFSESPGIALVPSGVEKLVFPPVLVLSAFQIKFLPVLILLLITPDDLVVLIRKGAGQLSSDEIEFCWKAIIH